MSTQWKPKSIDIEYTVDLDNPEWLASPIGCRVVECMEDLKKAGWRFFAVRQTRGFCLFSHKVITIPVWAIRKTQTHEGYLEWYLAHECAHALAGRKAVHGPEFMKALISICNSHYLHYETNYKPREAKSAGISSTAGNKIVQVGKRRYDVNEDDLLN